MGSEKVSCGKASKRFLWMFFGSQSHSSGRGAKLLDRELVITFVALKAAEPELTPAVDGALPVING